MVVVVDDDIGWVLIIDEWIWCFICYSCVMIWLLVVCIDVVIGFYVLICVLVYSFGVNG